MKEQVSNISKSLVSAATLLKEGKTEDAVAALEKAAEDVVIAETAAVEIEKAVSDKDAVITAKDAEITKSAETLAANEVELKKWSSLNVSTDTLPQLFEELGKVSSIMAGATEVLKTVSTKEDLTAITDRLDLIEKAKDKKQIMDEQRGEIQKCAVKGLDLTPRQ